MLAFNLDIYHICLTSIVKKYEMPDARACLALWAHSPADTGHREDTEVGYENNTQG